MGRVVVSFLIGFVLFFSTVAFASQDRLCDCLKEIQGEKFEVGVFGNYVLPSRGNFNNPFGGGSFIRYHFLDWLSAEVSGEIALWKFSTTITGDTGTLSGTLKVIPVTGSVRFHAPEVWRILPYGGFGITGLFVDGKASGTLTTGGASTVTIEKTWGTTLLLGASTRLFDSVYFYLEPRYTWTFNSYTSETATTGSISYGDVKMNHFVLRTGLSCKF